MNPNAQHLWRAPQWTFAALLAILGMLGPFSIDTYLPAFASIGTSLNASALQMQQTLSGFLFGYAVMSLFHGALSDSVGRRPVVLCGLGVFTLASVGCALSQTIGQLIFFRVLQGLCTGAGIVVARAVVRDMYAPSRAQKVMSQITLFFGIAPAIAPLIGGALLLAFSWRSVFWFLAGVGLLLWSANFRLLPETLHASHRHPLALRNLLSGYWRLGKDPRFILLALCSGVPFNGMFLYVLSAPVFLGELLALPPQQFFWFFVLNIAGIMAGAWMSGRAAGRHTLQYQIGIGFFIMLVTGLVNVALNAVFVADVKWALFPIAIYAFGWSFMMPAVTLLLLDLHPQRRGMASSLQTFVGALANALVAGIVSPLVMHSTLALSLASLALMAVGLFSWRIISVVWPTLGGEHG